MSLEIEMPKNMEDLEEGVVAETGVYELVLIEKRIDQNSKGTGQNLILELAITGANPDVDGIRFTEYLALPGPAYAGRICKNKRPLNDMMQESVAAAAVALGGTADGTKVTIPDHAKCKAKVGKFMSENGREYNRIDGPLMAIGNPIEDEDEDED